MALPIFVYGTLKPGGKLYHHVSASVREVLPARVPGRLYDTPFGYPLLAGAGQGGGEWVEGALLLAREGREAELEEIIDLIELEAGFRKKTVKAILEDEREVNVLVYLFDEIPPYATPFEGGCWPV